MTGTRQPTVPARPRQRAFSIMEMMVAVALLAIIMTALLSVFYESQRAFRSGVNQTDALEGGRTATSWISRELQEVTPSEVPGVIDFLVARPDGQWRELVQGLPGGDSRTNLLQDLTFVTRFNDDWHVTAYRVGDVDLGAGALYRWTFSTNAENLTNLFAGLFTSLPPFRAADAERDPRVIDGVVHFQVRAYDQHGRLLPELPLRQPLPVPGNWFGNAFPDTNNVVLTNTQLASLELELGILEPQTLAAFRARTNDVARARSFLANRANRVHLFRQRIPVRTGPVANSLTFVP